MSRLFTGWMDFRLIERKSHLKYKNLQMNFVQYIDLGRKQIRIVQNKLLVS